MTVRTCLLVSDDPDDYVEFAEGLYDIASDIVVIVVPDAQKAADLVLSKRHIPDYLFIDLSVNGFSHNEFFSVLDGDADFARVFLLAYGDVSDYERIKAPRLSAFLERDATYSDLRAFLKKLLANEL